MGMRRAGQSRLHQCRLQTRRGPWPPGRLRRKRQRELNDRSFVVLGPARNRGEPLAFWPKPAHEGPTFPSSTTASMGFKCGIVGLPNVGKSTLFNALIQTAAAQAANYPFCTIEPNVGDVAVPDPRLAILADIAGSKEIIPTRLTFVDIAGLVRGAWKGEGLGNQFLANIRECDAIAHVVRCFEDGDVTHVEGRIDPLSDIATIETELMLADLESLERRIAQIEKRAKGGDKDARDLLALAERSLAELKEGSPARAAGVGRDERRLVQSLGLLSSEPDADAATWTTRRPTRGKHIADRVERLAADEDAAAKWCRRRTKREIATCPGRAERLAGGGGGVRGWARTRPPRRLRPSASGSYLTAGPQGARAWGGGRGAEATQAAGVIHTDSKRASSARRRSPRRVCRQPRRSGRARSRQVRLEGKDYVSGRRRDAFPLRN